MLEGLEVSILKLSQIVNGTLSSRLDAEFFKKDYLKSSKSIERNASDKLVNVTNKINVGFVGEMVKHYRVDGVKLLQTKNINNFFLSDVSTVKIANSFHQELKKSQIKYEDILIARSGSFGKASIYLESEVINSSDIIIVEANKTVINPYFLVTFLNSNYGKEQMIRFASGGLQGHVNLTILEELQIPKLSVDFQNEIENMISISYSNLVTSKKKYTEAENLLVNELGLHHFKPSIKNIAIKSLSNSFNMWGRLDAEYYQPKYDELIEKLKKLNHKKLSSIVNIKKSIEPGSNAYQNAGIPFVRVSNISKLELTQPDMHLSPTLLDKNTLIELMPKKDTILLSKDGSVGIAYKVKENMKVITSGALLHLSINDNSILPEYLTLVLNSKAVQMQAERDAGGSIIQHWKPSEIANLIIPIIDLEIQQEIESKITKSFKLKEKSKQLLEVAKKAIEIAIDQSEQVAFQYIEENTNLGIN